LKRRRRYFRVVFPTNVTVKVGNWYNASSYDAQIQDVSPAGVGVALKNGDQLEIGQTATIDWKTIPQVKGVPLPKKGRARGIVVRTGFGAGGQPTYGITFSRLIPEQLQLANARFQKLVI
jgi:c-di-GMP-binding flagellar brake protein YcgR